VRVGVVGGSLGGLTAALVLRDAGFDVDVFERSGSPLVGYGAGLYLHEATARYLVERRGVDPDELGIRAATLRYLGPSGDAVFEGPLPYRMSSWGVLYHRLLEAFGRERYRVGHVLVSVDPDDAAATLRFASGATHRCDLVVAADGVLSTTRALLFPDTRPVYAGYVAWRGTVPAGAVPERTLARLRGALTYSVLEASHIVAYLIPDVDGPRLNFVWYRNVADDDELRDLMTDRNGAFHPISLRAGEVQERHVRSIRETARALLPPALADLVVAAEPFVQVVVDVESDRIVAGRVCLIGDAAFTARPHPAAGTAKACENAWALAGALARDSAVDRALAAWEPPMLELGRRLVEHAREIGNRSQFLGTWIPGDPSLSYGLRRPGD
jgi:2,6-dihydroxypyridine 3-monooxygenase